MEEFPALLRHYAERGLLRVVDGNQDIDQVHRQIMEALSSPAPRGQ
jgi:adenylate kinase family enzyme